MPAIRHTLTAAAADVLTHTGTYTLHSEEKFLLRLSCSDATLVPPSSLQIEAIIITSSFIGLQAVVARIKGTSPPAAEAAAVAVRLPVSGNEVPEPRLPTAPRAAAVAVAILPTDGPLRIRTPTPSDDARGPTSTAGNLKNLKKRSKRVTIRMSSCAKRLPCD